MSTYYNFLPLKQQKYLQNIAELLVADDKGILAADESETSMGKRLSNVEVENTAEIRRLYRQILFTSPLEISNYISGVILNDETLYQKTDDGVPFINLLYERSLLIGIKIDKGSTPIAGSENEVTTRGLDNLSERCAKFKEIGCDFSKFRVVFKLGAHTPSPLAIKQNAYLLARFAAISQSEGLVPIVEPEVLTDGDHDVDRCQKATEYVLSAIYKALHDQHVLLEGTILKTNMITSGISCNKRYTPEQIGNVTLATVRRCVPPAVPGITFLSGGYAEEDATVNLCAINKAAEEKCWALSFSFGRALQTSVIRCWDGKAQNAEAAQNELIKRCRANHMAIKGEYEPGSIPTFNDNDLFIIDE